jgi:hypothetical protein
MLDIWQIGYHRSEFSVVACFAMKTGISAELNYGYKNLLHFRGIDSHLSIFRYLQLWLLCL